MSEQYCENESATARAARSNKWEPSLRAHAGSCPVCREAVKVAQAMNSMVESVEIPPTPDPQRVWLKAVFAARQKRQTRVAQFVGVAYAVLVGALGFGVYLGLESGFASGLDISPTTPMSNSSIAPFLVILGGILLILLLSMPAHKRSR